MWGRVGLVGLSARDPDHIRAYRNLVEQLEDDRYCFTIFPRDAADKRGSISILLQENFRAFNPMCLPGSLFSRNRGLTGALKVTHIKTYREEEKSRSGLSKKDWKLVLLQGCGSFMKSLEEFDEDHKFSIGCGFVFIRGGIRRPKTPKTPAPRNNNHGRGAPRGRGHPRSDLNRSNQTTLDGPTSRGTETGSSSGRDGRGRGRGANATPLGRIDRNGPGARAPSSTRRHP